MSGGGRPSTSKGPSGSEKRRGKKLKKEAAKKQKVGKRAAQKLQTQQAKKQNK